jgi:hypothetical protein
MKSARTRAPTIPALTQRPGAPNPGRGGCCFKHVRITSSAPSAPARMHRAPGPPRAPPPPGSGGRNQATGPLQPPRRTRGRDASSGSATCAASNGSRANPPPVASVVAPSRTHRFRYWLTDGSHLPAALRARACAPARGAAQGSEALPWNPAARSAEVIHASKSRTRPGGAPHLASSAMARFSFPRSRRRA